jgi:hypothetical protein
MGRIQLESQGAKEVLTPIGDIFPDALMGQV